MMDLKDQNGQIKNNFLRMKFKFNTIIASRKLSIAICFVFGEYDILVVKFMLWSSGNVNLGSKIDGSSFKKERTERGEKIL